MLKILLKISESLEKIVSIFGKIGSWLAIPLISIIIFDIITRRFFVLGSTKLQEMEWHLHTSLFLLVLGYAYLKDAHVRIEIVREKYALKVIFILQLHLPSQYRYHYYGLPQYMKLNKYLFYQALSKRQYNRRNQQ